MHLFKKKKSCKGLIDQLNDQLGNLPTSKRVQELLTEAVKLKRAESTARRSFDDTNLNAVNPRKMSTFSRLQSFKTAAPLQSQSHQPEDINSIMLKPDCVIGLEDGLQQTEVVALDVVEKKLNELALYLSNTDKEEEIAILVKHALETDLIAMLLTQHSAMSFKSRQYVATLICGMLQKSVTNPDLKSLLDTYMKQHRKRLLEKLLKNYENPIIFLHTGNIFRSFLKHEAIYLECLSEDFLVLNLFFKKYLKVENFENVSDAFTTFRRILQGNIKLVSEYLDIHYDQFFPQYNELLKSAEYIAQRQSLKLLSDLLLIKQNSKVMLKYIGETSNLVLIMNLMRVTSQSMRLEAFHVFKIFVANPNKADGIKQILQRNKDKLINYLSKLTTERDNEVSQDEKDLIIRTLQTLPSLESNLEPQQNS